MNSMQKLDNQMPPSDAPCHGLMASFLHEKGCGQKRPLPILFATNHLAFILPAQKPAASLFASPATARLIARVIDLLLALEWLLPDQGAHLWPCMFPFKAFIWKTSAPTPKIPKHRAVSIILSVKIFVS
jgi:hypothetical protein